MKRRWLAIALAIILILTLLCLLAQLALSPWPSQAQGEATDTATPIAGDAYEPDDPGTGDPPWIAEGETQNRSFAPEGDVDRARLYVKAGRWYQVQTSGLGPLVDTSLTVEVSGTLLEDDDGGPEPLASRVLFQAPADGEVLITVTNRQAVYGPEQTYKLGAGEAAAPTATPTSTPRPTSPPLPTATPPRPVINFSATPEHLEKPGDCTTLRWVVDRASEVFLVLPNGNQEGVEGLGERQVCPVETSEYVLKVNAPGGNETVRVQVSVPLPTPTPAPTSKPAGEGGGSPKASGKATLHVVVFVDNNGNGTHDPDEGVRGAIVYLRSQAAPDRVVVETTNAQGQVRFEKTAAGSYAVLIPHLGRAEAVNFRGEETTVGVVIPALRLPSRIP
ncbi:MAG: hypothetical protein JXM73_09745 [Anaerolineae bacterium]|nr:hypothetical protein [Anaerolineae bacterium]